MGTKIALYTDYSPWGIVALLVVNGKIAAWIAGGLDATDEEMLDIRIGDPAGQQAGELLAVLVALRARRQFWQGRQVQLMVKADNVSALTAVLYLKGGATMKLLCQELALEMAASTLRPAAQYVQGVANGLADSCSRRFAPPKEPNDE